MLGEKSVGLLILIGAIAGGVYLVVTSGPSAISLGLIGVPLVYATYAFGAAQRSAKAAFELGWNNRLNGDPDATGLDTLMNPDALTIAAYGQGYILAEASSTRSPEAEFNYSRIKEIAKEWMARGVF